MTGVPSRATAPVTVSSAEYARRHIAVRLLPFVFILYIINYLDRTSVAYAAIGMARDHGFDDRVFGLGVGVFFLSYVALQIPGAVLAQRWSARGTICASMIVSGFLTALTAVVHTPAQLYLARFLLGAAEAGFRRKSSAAPRRPLLWERSTRSPASRVCGTVRVWISPH